MKILVTGGAGFIGSWIVDKLIERGESVSVVDYYSLGKKENENARAIYYHADICDEEKLNEIFLEEKPELVIHCAANSLLRKSIENPVEDARVNILGTISVLEACRKNNVKNIIYTSTGGARVGEPDYLPVDEKHPLRPLSPYGISKHTAEHYVEMYSRLHGMDYFIFCFGNVYGPRDLAKSGRLVPFFISQIMKGETPIIFGDGNQTRDFIYVEDIADFIVACLQKLGKTEHQLFHLANGKQVSVNEVCELLKKISEREILFKHDEAIKGEVRDIVLDTSLARKELDWNPTTSLEEGLKKTWEWFGKRK
jgi:UDP-glucose 4-epimerase